MLQDELHFFFARFPYLKWKILVTAPSDPKDIFMLRIFSLR